MNREMKRAQAKAERQQKAAGLDRKSAPADGDQTCGGAREEEAHRAAAVPARRSASS